MKILSTNNLLPSQMAVLPTKNTFKSKMSLEEQITKTHDELRQVTGAMEGEKEVIKELWNEYFSAQTKKEKDSIIHIIDGYEEPVFERNRLEKINLEKKLKSLLQQKEFLGQKHFPKI